MDGNDDERERQQRATDVQGCLSGKVHWVAPHPIGSAISGEAFYYSRLAVTTAGLARARSVSAATIRRNLKALTLKGRENGTYQVRNAKIRLSRAPAVCRRPARSGPNGRARARPGQLSGQRFAARGRRYRPRLQWAPWRMAGVCYGPQTAGSARHPRADPASGPPARPDLRLRAAQARPPRLHGAESGRDGSLDPATGADPAHPGVAGEWRADARQRGRGGGTMRHPQPRRCRGARSAGTLSRTARP